jgi:hypothetical protein
VAEGAWRDRQVEIRALVTAVLERALAISAAPDSTRRIASHYGLTPTDVTAWLGTTRWATRVEIDPAELDEVLGVLGALGLVPGGLTGQLLIAA